MLKDDPTSIKQRIAELQDRLKQAQDAHHAPDPALALGFLVLLVVQGGHEAEHIVQVIQRFVFNYLDADGLLGQYFNTVPLHLAYNVAFFWLLLLVYRLGGAHRPDLWARGMTAWWLLTIALAFQGYHLVEELLGTWQLIDTGQHSDPGIFGNAIHPIWLHFAINTVAYLPVVVLFWLGGFHRHLKVDLQAAWTDLIGRPTVRTAAGGSPTLSRRALLVGAAGLAVAVGTARVAVTNRRPEIQLPTFVDVTARAGITFRHRSYGEEDPIQAGAAFFDYDGDGRPDVFLTSAGGPNALYRNNGDGTFSDVTARAGLDDPDGITIGVACADFNNNGHCDLLLTRLTGLQLLRNNGDGTFTDVTYTSLFYDGEGHPSSAAWIDFDGDGHLDLYVAYTVDGGVPEFSQIATPGDDLGKAFTTQARSHRLFRNNGNGTFRDVTEYLGEDRVHGAGLGVGALDYDDDGRPDLYIANDFGFYIQPNVLLRNAGPSGDEDWAFEDVSKKARVDAAINGMGLAFGDYDGDGRLDMYTTNIGDNVLYRNQGDGTFEETTNRARVGRGMVWGEDSVGWGTAFLDFDNDGLLDLYFVAGTDDPEVNAAGVYPPDQPNALFHNRGDGTFRDVSKVTGTDHTGIGRGLAIADYDGDGFLDLLVANYGQKPALLRNSGNDSNWLGVRLVGQRSNRDGIGARLTLRTGGQRQIREIVSGTSFLSRHSLGAHFGLGHNHRVDELTIRWPSGIVQKITDPPANQKITVTEAI